MNWMNAFCLLAGVGVGVEIAYLVMKYRTDIVAEKVHSLEARIGELLDMNGRIIDKWSETIDLNTELIKSLEERD